MIDHPVIRQKLGMMIRKIESTQAWIDLVTLQLVRSISRKSYSTHFNKRRAPYFVVINALPFLVKDTFQLTLSKLSIQPITPLLSIQVSMPEKEARERLGGPVALLKTQATSCYEFCARESAQIFGGLAYTKGGLGEKVERLNRDLRVYVVGGGSEEIMLGAP